MELTQEQINQIEARKESIARLYSDSVFRRMLVGHIPPALLTKILALPEDSP